MSELDSYLQDVVRKREEAINQKITTKKIVKKFRKE